MQSQPNGLRSGRRRHPEQHQIPRAASACAPPVPPPPQPNLHTAVFTPIRRAAMPTASAVLFQFSSALVPPGLAPLGLAGLLIFRIRARGGRPRAWPAARSRGPPRDSTACLVPGPIRRAAGVLWDPGLVRLALRLQLLSGLAVRGQAAEAAPPAAVGP